MKLLASIVTGGIILATSLGAAQADNRVSEIVQKAAYGASLAEGISSLRNGEGNNSEKFGLGVLLFLQALEGLQQDLYRYGAGNQQFSNRTLSRMIPIFRVPVSSNPNPETPTYEDTRNLLKRFVDGMAAAEAALSSVSEDDIKLELSLPRIVLDANSNGAADLEEGFAGLMTLANPRAGRAFTGDQAKMVEKLTFSFDNADAVWLRGYSNVLMSFGNLLLAFDYEKSYDAVFHNVFGIEATEFGRLLPNLAADPDEIAATKARLDEINKEIKVGFPKEKQDRLSELQKLQRDIRKDKTLTKEQRKEKQDETRDELQQLRTQRSAVSSLRSDKRRLERQLAIMDTTNSVGSSQYESFFDPIAFLHSVSWPVVEPDRLKSVRTGMLKVMELNRVTWRLARAETDDDREWLPNPTQTNPFPSIKVTDELIDGWLEIVVRAEDVLEGRTMVPTMRFSRGVNMKKFFTTAESFDLVLFLTGQNSIKYVEKGPMINQRVWRRLQDPLGNNMGTIALWFN